MADNLFIFNFKLQLKKIILSCAKFITLVFILDLALGFSLEKLYTSQTNGEFKRLEYSLHNTNADMLIFGSSRANHHYDPFILNDSLKLSYYNVGQDGQSIFYHYAILKATLKRYKPKLIVLDVNLNEFRKSSKAYERLSSLLPQYKRIEELDEIIGLRGPYEKVKLISKIYPYNSLAVTLISNKISPKHKDDNSVKGFMPLTGSDTLKLAKDLNNINNIIVTNYEIDTLKICYFKKFINDVRKNNIDLVVLTSPFLCKEKINDRSIGLIDSICRLQNVRYYNYSYTQGISSNLKLFVDYGHLNNTGAKQYTQLIVKHFHKG